jgi:hypothetical protein
MALAEAAVFPIRRAGPRRLRRQPELPWLPPSVVPHGRRGCCRRRSARPRTGAARRPRPAAAAASRCPPAPSTPGSDPPARAGRRSRRPPAAARWGQHHELALEGAGTAKPRRHPVALGDQVDDLLPPVGEGGAEAPERLPSRLCQLWGEQVLYQLQPAAVNGLVHQPPHQRLVLLGHAAVLVSSCSSGWSSFEGTPVQASCGSICSRSGASARAPGTP